ncbi:hypothetical protein [Microbacterium sp.]|uniref:hypothetical protein n=1 Tax=Microbacterium sp. TaxID=51671 RepID=UPI002BAF341B|nr:hypothetical protein [Microbacterium sp.]HWL77531.1 hypothetical protein [Microbacterium sp.]
MIANIATTPWLTALAHREPSEVAAVASRFEEVGVTPEMVRETIADLGATLTAAAAHCDDEHWADPFGGPLAVALLAAEVSAFASHVVSLASRVRSIAVDDLLEDFSAVDVAARLGVSRQKVYEIGRVGARLRASTGKGRM